MRCTIVVSESIAIRRIRRAILAQHGLPPLVRSPVLTCRAYYPGGSLRVHLSAASPDRAAFPVERPSRRPQLPFRGLFRLHTRCGPSIRSTAKSGLCRSAQTRPVTQPSLLPATRPTDHCPGGTFTREANAPFRAHLSGRTFRREAIRRLESRVGAEVAGRTGSCFSINGHLAERLM